jgi:hypothetical protein
MDGCPLTVFPFRYILEPAKLRFFTGHSRIDPKRTQVEPGPGSTAFLIIEELFP